MTELPVRADAKSPIDVGALSRFGRALLAELAADRVLYVAVALYALAAVALAAALGLRIEPFAYASVWGRLLLLMIFAYVGFIEVPLCIRANPAAPMGQLLARLRSANAARLAAGFLLAMLMGVFLGVFTGVKTMLPRLAEFSWDLPFAELDRTLHGTDPWRLLHPLLGHPAITRAVEFVYLNVWAMAVIGAVAWAACAPMAAGRRRRLLLTYLLCWIVLGTVAAGLFFSAGPCFYGEVTGDAARFAALTGYHAGNVEGSTGVHLIQQTLWRLHEQGRMEIGAGISAFPSLHVAMATMVVIVGFCINRKLGYAAIGYLLLILVSSVHLGWHYAVDGYASIAVTLGLWFALQPLERGDRPRAAA